MILVNSLMLYNQNTEGTKITVYLANELLVKMLFTTWLETWLLTKIREIDDYLYVKTKTESLSLVIDENANCLQVDKGVIIRSRNNFKYLGVTMENNGSYE